MDADARIVVLLSGQGSNLSALLRARTEGRLSASIVAVGSDRSAAPGLRHADAAEIPTFVCRPRDHGSRAHWNRALASQLAAFAPDLVVLAGLMRIVSQEVLDAASGRVINVHPSLLPSFPGLRAPEQALRAGVAISGCTVHWVDSGVDTGPILAQSAVPVLPEDSATSLHQRIQAEEHWLLPAVVERVLRGPLPAAGTRPSAATPLRALAEPIPAPPSRSP